MSTLDDKQRYAVYRRHNGKCHHCGTRLNWDAHSVKGLSGSWELAPVDRVRAASEGEDEATAQQQALCYKCLAHDRKVSGRLHVSEE